MCDYWHVLRYWLYRHIGELSDVSLKHRSAVILLSVLLLFLDHDVAITFGSASLAGLGISVTPPQTIPVGTFLLLLLIYRFFAFVASISIESGVNPDLAGKKARYQFDPAYDAEERSSHDMDQIVRYDSNEITYKWRGRQILWEVIFPCFLAAMSIGLFLFRLVAAYVA